MRTRGLFFLLGVTLLLPGLSFGQGRATECVTLSGNVNAGSPVTTVPSNPSYEDLASTASFSSFFEVQDSLLVSHVVTAYFFKTADNNWTVTFYVDAGEVGGSSGSPVLVASFSLQFTNEGERTTTPGQTTGDVATTPPWSNGADQGLPIILTLAPFTQLANASSISSVKKTCENSARIETKPLDFDDDGIADLAIWRPSNGYWAIRLSATNTLFWKQFGLPGDIAVPGDYDGDKAPDLVVWRPTTGVWWICRSGFDYDCSRPISIQFGLPGDTPVASDFDGDGKNDLAVWRISNGNYYYWSSRTGQIFALQWGLPGDIPLGTPRASIP